MYEYLKGKVVYVTNEFIILECNNVAYKIYITESKFEINENLVIYVYLHINDNSRSLFGFKSRLEREVFYKFLLLKNIGVKTAFNIVKNDNYELILDAAFNCNYDFLLTLNKINENNVDLLIKSLKSVSYKNFFKIDEIYYSTLKGLDYSDSEIYKSYKLVDKELSSNLMIKEGIKIIESGDLK